ncbi:MAG: hypothetical protein A2V21_307955 [Deltaproteobacteria bacterium GWC2_55_46]|nr:MAG: hypothetical protein A2Z79_02055 [Deltaproteobacteria bacterium GWA2_55_82]OGQ62611.1 MAG: hypothetical protein A3I81_08870 [Deltaproteobacteria bacterium RIFCSPLOWO2_02_FULL_55_12]OIJ74201.1 MAG: hypothetical protein A2V21_307955 [Deltaproteobacteria bacterium GWC2_55_46]
MKSYRLHTFVCQGKQCSAKGSEAIHESLKEKIRDRGLKGEVKSSRSGCLGVCRETGVAGEYSPVIVVYPEGTWYRNVTIEDVDEIIEKHLKGGQPVERLLHFRLDTKTV